MYDTFDTGITVYCHSYDKQTREDLWTRFQVKGVSWYGGQKVTVGDSGLSTADTYTVRIPATAVPDGFAPGSGDIVVKGLLDLDITRKKELDEYQRFAVTGCYDNRRGIPAMQHLRIEGK